MQSYKGRVRVQISSKQDWRRLRLFGEHAHMSHRRTPQWLDADDQVKLTNATLRYITLTHWLHPAVTRPTTSRIATTRGERRNWTELNWHGLVFDQLTNARAR